MSVQFSQADVSARVEPRVRCKTFNAMFFVTAQADPGIAPRLVEPFAKMGVVPARVHISSEDGNGEEITADLRLACAARCDVKAIDKALRRIVGVRQVIALTE
jgi:hypothetical protein